MLASVLLTSLSLLLAAFAWWQRRRAAQSLLARAGFPGPPCPSLIAGHFAALRSDPKRCPVHVMAAWERRHGPVYGLSFGPTPVVVVGDARDVQRVVARSAKVFPDRPPLAIPVKPVTESLVGLRGGDWKRVRRVLASMLSPVNCRKVLSPVIHQKLDACMESLMTVSEQEDPVTIDLVTVSERLCFDVVGMAVLGIDPDEELFDAVRAFLGQRLDGAIKAAIYCPALVGGHHLGGGDKQGNLVTRAISSLAQTFGFHPKASKLLYAKVKAQVEARKSGLRKDDILQMMVDEMLSEDSRISEEEVIANAWVFLLGGFDTVAQALAFTLFLLAANPECQDKVHQEILSDIQDPSKPDFETVLKLPYLDKVLKESLRLYPPVNLNVSRRCEKNFQLRNGAHIPAGATVHLPLFQLHRNEEYWREPEKFLPERFKPEEEKARTKMCYIPFGAGPRYCIGKDFAIFETKMALVRILHSFRFETMEQGQELDLTLPLVTLKAKNGIPVKMYRREGFSKTVSSMDKRDKVSFA
ncbi:unnamed protein product [Notodromas monacha]|uniref:Cytochrome P450 n=1 Tax=Notodromas monacha TaxID=399045 RepID=A0A7R9BIF5_9CRUS|nr:unnamed protein product [Notodromas monacha]CAG0916102.1 unnamed protein product [Notodromas monacha]